MKIILDFDDTIFNTHRLFNDFLNIFLKAGFLKKEFLDNYQETKKRTGYLNLEMASDLLFHKTKISNQKSVKKETENISSRMKQFVYPDFFIFAKNFNKNNLILLSYGNSKFQNRKIEKSQIIPFFSEIIIAPKDKIETIKVISQKYKKEKLFFIDDKAEQVDSVKEKFPQIITMKMERPHGKHINIKSKLANYIVKDLNEAKNIILKS